MSSPSRDLQSDTGSALDWRLIATAPRDGVYVLTFCPHPDPRDGEVVAAKFMDIAGYGECWLDSADSEINTPTHWMPLPPPPVQQTSAALPG